MSAILSSDTASFEPLSQTQLLSVEVLDNIVRTIGYGQYSNVERSFPGLLDRISRVCASQMEQERRASSLPIGERVLASLNGVRSASPVVTTDSVYYLPMKNVPLGQKLIALGPGGCGVFEQLTKRNVEDYYGWFPMPKIPEDNPIRMQYRISEPIDSAGV